MGVLDKIRGFFKPRSKADASSDEVNRFLQFLGVDVTNTSAINEATYFACLRLRAEAIGKLPLKLMQWDNVHGINPVRGDPRYYILGTRPNRYMTATTFWSTVEYNVCHYGNCYVLISGAGAKMSLWILPTESIQVINDDKDLFKKGAGKLYYVYSGESGIYTFSDEEILHFKTSSTFDGIIGKSVRERLSEVIDSGNDSQKMLRRMYKNGYTGKAVLQYTGDLNDKLVQTYIKGIEAYASGSDDEKRDPSTIIPIPVGSTLTPLNVKLSDGQFLEIKQYTALQIAAAFGIKPYQINDFTKSSYASGELQQIDFYVDTLLYPLKQYEEEITFKILSMKEAVDRGMFWKFNVAVTLRADFKTQVETLSKAVNTFIMTPNEARERLDLGSVEHGDKLIGQGANIRLDQIGAQYNAQNSPADDPPEEGGNEEDAG